MIAEPNPPVADDEDDDWDWLDEDPDLVPTPAHASPPDGPTMLNDLLLELTTYTTRLRVLLTEAEEDEFRAALPRFKGFIEEVERLPAEPQRRRRIGFQAPPPKPVKATKKTKKGASKKKR